MASITPKQYLETEDERNRTHADLFTAMVQRAFGASNSVLVGHHICFENAGDITTENEIPSADSLIFDHDIMRALFGDDAISLMQRLAATSCEARDRVLRDIYETRFGPIEG